MKKAKKVSRGAKKNGGDIHIMGGSSNKKQIPNHTIFKDMDKGGNRFGGKGD